MLAFGLLCCCSSRALTEPLDDCNGDDMPKRLVGCTELLKATDLSPADRALVLSLRSDAHASQRNVDGAIDDLKQATELQPEDVALRERLAMMLARRSDDRLSRNELLGAIDDLSEAIKFARGATPLRARVARLYEARGLQLDEAGDRKGAIEAYSKAIEFDAKRAELHALRGRARVATDDNGGASKDFTEALAIEPTNEIAKRALRRLSIVAQAKSRFTESERVELAHDIQRQLQRLGCYAGKIDGKWGRESSAAAETFLKANGSRPIESEPSEQLLLALLQERAKACKIETKKSPSDDSLQVQKKRSTGERNGPSKASLCKSCNTRQSTCDKRCVRDFLGNHNALIHCYERCGAYSRLEACQRKYCM